MVVLKVEMMVIITSTLLLELKIYHSPTTVFYLHTHTHMHIHTHDHVGGHSDDSTYRDHSSGNVAGVNGDRVADGGGNSGDNGDRVADGGGGNVAGVNGDRVADGGGNVAGPGVDGVQVADGGGSGSCDLGDPDIFTIEEELKYAARFEEGYDLIDPRYEAWLKKHCPTNKDAISLTTKFIATKSTESDVKLPSKSVPSATTSMGSSTNRSPLSNLLNLPMAPGANKPQPKTGRARVLTSSECLRLLKEKEEKKRQVAIEKEQRKKERELKKQQKAQQMKQKAEERACKAAEREKAKAEKAKERERKAQERAASKSKSLVSKQQTNRNPQGIKRTADTNTVKDPRPTCKKVRVDMAESFNTDWCLCCVCFGSYQEDIDTGREWLQCSCGKWLHEDCVDDSDMDNETNRLCPLC